MEEEPSYDGFISFLREKIKALKPESPVPGIRYAWGNRHEARTLEMGIRGMEEDPEIFSALQQGRLDMVQECLGTGRERTGTLYRYWSTYKGKLNLIDNGGIK